MTPETPACILGTKAHHFVLIGDKRGNLHRQCAHCKLDPVQVGSLNQATAMAITIEAVILLLDDNDDYDLIKRRLFDAAKRAGLIPANRSKEADNDGG